MFLFSVLVSLIGIGMLALPAGILASGFSAEIRRRNDTYAHALETALADGQLSVSEARELNFLRESLGLSEDQAQSLLKSVERRRHTHSLKTCPSCGHRLRDDKEQD